MSTLQRLETSPVVYGKSPHPGDLPARQSLKLARMAKAVSFLIANPSPNVTALADDLGVSRATVYRVFAEPEFQSLLRQAISGRISLAVNEALDGVLQTIREGSPGLRLRASMWLVERFDKLRAQAGELRSERAEFEIEEMMAGLRESNERRRAKGSEGEFAEAVVESVASQPGSLRRADLAALRASEDELVDVELEEREESELDRGA